MVAPRFVAPYLLTQHAIERLRLRWSCSSISNRDLIQITNAAVMVAFKHRTAVTAPGGVYVPFSLAGKDGYIVVREGTKIVTVLEEDQCPEIRAFTKDTNG